VGGENAASREGGGRLFRSQKGGFYLKLGGKKRGEIDDKRGRGGERTRSGVGNEGGFKRKSVGPQAEGSPTD